MKIDKTKREWVDAVLRACSGQLEAPGEVIALHLAGLLDLEFQPEEPELPERVKKSSSGSCLLVPEGQSKGWPSVLVAITDEAAVRYNAMGRLLSEWPIGWVVRILREERERLQ